MFCSSCFCLSEMFYLWGTRCSFSGAQKYGRVHVTDIDLSRWWKRGTKLPKTNWNLNQLASKQKAFKKKNLDIEISPPAPITSRKTREKKKLNELQEAMAIHKHKNKIETEQVYLHGPNSVDMDLSSICHKRPKTVGSPKSRRYKSVSLAVAVRVYLLTPQL